MALDAEQRRVAKLIIQIGRKRRESPKEIKAAIETGLVESGLRNLNHGDGTSIGWRQETASSYPGKNRRDLKASINRFYNETSAVERKYGKSGQLAQAVQRSAFPGRYAQQSKTAQSIIRSNGGTGGGGSGSGGSGGSTETVPGVDRSDQRKKIVAQFLLGQQDQPDPEKDPYGLQSSNSLLTTLVALKQAKDTPSEKIKIPGRASSRGPSSAKGAKGTAMFEGKRVAAWIKPELEYARRHGWKGTVNSGFRSRAEQTRIYNSGVRPAAKPGTSNHEGADFPRGAVDVSDAATLARILRRKGSPLKFAGSKDPVHFSHPHGGSY